MYTLIIEGILTCRRQLLKSNHGRSQRGTGKGCGVDLAVAGRTSGAMLEMRCCVAVMSSLLYHGSQMFICSI